MSLVYLIENIDSGKKYVGKVVKTGKTEIDRFKEHVAESKKARCKGYLHRAIRTYGQDKFKVSVLELCEDADAREKYWIFELKPEYNMTDGGEGGSTTHGRSWYNDGQRNIYLMNGDDIPAGFKKGRLCKFNDPEFQRQMAARTDRKKAGKAIKEAWSSGKFANRVGTGVSGELNPAKRPEVRLKISESKKGIGWSEERKLAKSMAMTGKKRGRYNCNKDK